MAESPEFHKTVTLLTLQFSYNDGWSGGFMTKKRTSGFDKIIAHCAELTRGANKEWRTREIVKAEEAISDATEDHQRVITPYQIVSDPNHVKRLQAAMNKAHNEIVGRQ